MSKLTEFIGKSAYRRSSRLVYTEALSAGVCFLTTSTWRDHVFIRHTQYEAAGVRVFKQAAALLSHAANK